MRALWFVAALAFSIVAAGCSGSSDGAADDAAAGTESGVRVVSAEEGGSILADPPADLVVLDVRTPEEFAAGHLPGAILIDFNAPGFADEVAELDPEVPYLLYCRSGNRSSGARAVMTDLGFVDVADVDGGILAWSAADLPITTG